MPSQQDTDRFQIVYGTRAVWVNAIGCLGRFGQMGIEVYRSLDEAQPAGLPYCLYFRPVPVTLADWPRFVEAMWQFHAIDLRDQPVPEWLA